MAGSARYTALLDANTLYPAPLRDLLLSLAVAGLYHARWSTRIHEEWTRNLARQRPEIAGRLPQIVQLMNTAVPDSLVTGFEPLINGLQLPDPDDRHVLAAAIVGHADAIVTFNLKDFPADVLARHELEALHPDDFVMNQLELRQLDALAAIKTMRARLRNPAVSAADLIGILERCGLPQSAARLRHAESLI
jgi:predicted nucleic acid-binding protein